MGVREKQVWYFHGAETMYTTQLTEFKGLSDLYVGLALRLPFDMDHFCWRISAGAYLPVANYKPEKPTHTSVTMSDSLGTFHEIRFHYNNKVGNGSMICSFGTAAQVSLEKMAITGMADYSLSFSETETQYWESRLYEDEFTHQSVPYKTKPGTTLSFALIYDYQAIEWFDVFARVTGMMYSGGWDEKEEVRIGHLDRADPALAVGVAVEQFGLVLQRGVHGGDGAGDGGVDVAHRLRAPDLGERVVRSDGGPDLGKFDEHDVSERVLGVVGDADRHGIAVAPAPLMVRGVAQVVGDVHIGSRIGSGWIEGQVEGEVGAERPARRPSRKFAARLPQDLLVLEIGRDPQAGMPVSPQQRDRIFSAALSGKWYRS